VLQVYDSRLLLYIYTHANPPIRPVFRGGVKGVETPPPEKSTQKFLGLPFCGNVEHVQPKNVAVTQYQQATQDVHCLLIWKLTGNLLSKLGTEDRTSVTYCQ